MLFDLRGRGRRRTVQVIYVGLAVLMGGGLVLFGIGSSSSGGLFDAFSGNGASSSSATDSLDKRIKAAVVKTKADPKDAAALAQLAILRFQRASVDGITADGTYTDDGKRRLQLAADAWEQALALNPPHPSVRAATLMVQAYGASGLNQLSKAVDAKQIVTAAEDPPSSNQFAQLAQLAYQAGDTRVGDLAATRAIDLAAASDRKALKTALDTLKSSAAAQAAQGTATTATG
jgi:hypothetical protein